MVFQKSSWRYLLDYVWKLVIAAAVCAATGFIAGLVPASNVYLAFLAKMAVAVIVPNLLLGLICFRDPNYLSLLNLAKKTLLRRGGKA